MAASAAATVRMKNTNTWPAVSCRKCENATKFMFDGRAAFSSQRTHQQQDDVSCGLMMMPATLIENRIAPSSRKSD